MKLDSEQQKQNLLQIISMYVKYLTGEPKPSLNEEGMMQIGILTTQLKAQITQAKIEQAEIEGRKENKDATDGS